MKTRRPLVLALAALLGLTPAFLVVATAAQGCVLADFTLAEDDGGSGGGDAGDAGDAKEEPETGPPGCDEALPPYPPDPSTEAASVSPFVVAMHSIDMGDKGTTPGYDLDKTCTCILDAGGTCAPRMNGHLTCDGPGGVDDAAQSLFAAIKTGLAGGVDFGSDYFSARADEGRWSLLIAVSNYNGKPDDPSVDVVFYPSPGFQPDPAPDAMQSPSWSGSDKWHVSGSAVGDGGVADPLYTSKGAYVSGGILVAAVPDIAMTIAGGSETLTVKLVGGFVTGKLESQGGGRYRMTKGVIAARWPVQEVFNTMSSYRDPNGNPFCTDKVIVYPLAKDEVCQTADILVNASDPPSITCDAISVGLGFTADPAILGDVGGDPPKTPGCPPPTDPANDSCP